MQRVACTKYDICECGHKREDHERLLSTTYDYHWECMAKGYGVCGCFDFKLPKDSTVS